MVGSIPTTVSPHPVRNRAVFGCAVTCLALLVRAATAQAQPEPRGFLLGPPAGSVSFRAGVNRASAGSDIFTFVTRELTVDRSDFRTASLVAEVGASLTPRVGLVFGASVGRSETPSEFRDWLDNRDLPIEQSTRLSRTALSASAKVYLVPPGRSIGRFAWIPSRLAPYVGAGAGVMRYRFEQEGDFIDFQTFRVFRDKYSSSGWRPMGQALAGGDISLSPRVAVSVEGRYEWARARLGLDFSGFDPIDLSGVSMTAGVTFRY
jgi:hypothetical protein